MRTLFIVVLMARALLTQEPPTVPPGIGAPGGPIHHVPVPVGVPIGVPIGPGAGTSAAIPSSAVTTSDIREPAGTAAGSAPTTSRSSMIAPRIREITKPHGGVPHHLTGIGVIAGLSGTGSSDRSTRQAILNFLRAGGLNHVLADVSSGGTALVSLTAELQQFAKEGAEIPVKVQVLGDATSLSGGELLRAELRGVDGLTYVVAQGALDPGGYAIQGANATFQKNLSTTATISSGGYVVRSVDSSFYSESGAIELRVSTPTPFNASSIADGIRTELLKEGLMVTAVDPSLVRIMVPADQRTHENAIRLLNRVGNVRVQVENPVRVVIDQATGAIVAGEGLLISPCVIGLTDLMIAVVEDDEIVQPGPLSNGSSERISRTRIDVQNTSSGLKPVSGGATVADLLQNLKALGLTTPQLIAVFLTLKKQGFLHAELKVL